MESIEKFIINIKELPNDKFKKILIVLASATILFSFVFIYKFYYDQSVILEKIESSGILKKKIVLMLERKKFMEQNMKTTSSTEEKSLLSIVENVSKKLEVSPNPDYEKNLKSTPIPFYDDLQEESVNLKLDKLSLKKIINFIDSLRAENSVMFREVKIEDSGESINCSLLLSMRKRKNV